MRRLTIMTLATLLLASSTSFAQKRRVAVMNFDYGTVQSWASQIMGANTDVGKGVADMLINKLVQDGRYSVIERKALDKILAEQNFSNSDRADPNSAAKIGRLLGVDAIIVGSITQFGRDDKNQKIAGDVMSRVTGKYGLGGIGTKNSKAVVGLSARLVSVDTAEIMAVATGKGESKRSGTSLLGSGGGSVAGTGAYDMGSSNFSQTIIGEAVSEAVNSVASQLDSQAGAMPARVISVNALVADVSGDQVTLNVGSRAGVKVGDVLHVKRVGREIRDPSTGKVIRRVEDPLGDMTITEVGDTYSVGRYAGANKPKVGDAASNQ